MKWISVKERLPENSSPVFINDEDTGFYIGSYFFSPSSGERYWEIGILMDYDMETGIHGLRLEECDRTEDFKITHWAEIPSEMDEEEEDDQP